MTVNLNIKYFLIIMVAFLAGILSVLPAKFLLLMLSVILVPFIIYAFYKNHNLLIATIIYFFIIDTSGTLLPVPVKPLLFLILMVKIIPFLKEKTSDGVKLIFITMAFVLPAYGAIVSVYRGNSLTYIISDANSYVFFIIGYFLFVLIRRDETLKTNIINHMLIASALIAIGTIILYILTINYIIPLEMVNEFLKAKGMGMAIIEVDGNYRIFLAGQIYMVVSSLYLINKLLNKNEKITTINLLLTGLMLGAVLISNTRGLWVAFAIGFIILFFINKFSIRKLLIVLSLMCTIALSSLLLKEEFWDNAYNRIISINDFSQNNLSNYIRYQQSVELQKEFNLYPVLGKGFGSTLSSGYYRNANMPFTFELSYLELLYKLGVFGFSLFAVVLIAIATKILKVKNKEIRNFSFASFCALLFISTTNPYIVSSLGIFLLSILLALTASNNNNTKSL